MINVLYISHEHGDILGSTLSLTNLLNSVKEEVRPIVILPKQGKVCDFFKGHGIKYYVVPFNLNIASSRLRCLKYIPKKILTDYKNHCAIKSLMKIVKKEHVQLIHTNTSVVTIGATLSKKSSIKHIWHLREFQDLDFNFMPFTGWKTLRRMIQESDAIIAITKAIAVHFKVASKENCYVMHDAVRSIKDACYIPSKQKYLLFLGHITPKKGAEVALNIFMEFWKKHQDYKLYYIGPVTDEYKDHLMTIIDKSGIDKNCVLFLGYKENVEKYLYYASVLLMCSQNEAQGRVTIEAMFYGCPVLGYRSGGTQEIIQDGVNGFLFSDITEAVNKLTYIVENDNQQVTLNAIDYVKENFSEEMYGRKILSIYKSLIKF